MNRPKLIGTALVAGAFLLAGGCSKSDAPAASTTSETTGSPQVSPPSAVNVSVIADDKGFTPSSVDVKKGTPTRLVFTRTTDDTCAKEVVFPELKITKPLPLNEKVAFDVPVADARTLTFQCGMGMFRGRVVVN